MEETAWQVGEDVLLNCVQRFCWWNLVLYPVVAAGARHTNSYFLCDEGWEYQPTDNEHWHSGLFFWRCPADGGRQHRWRQLSWTELTKRRAFSMPPGLCWLEIILQGATCLVEIKGTSLLITNHLCLITQIHYLWPSPKVPDTLGYHL